MNQIEQFFCPAGGKLLIPAGLFNEKASRINAFIFDWDGVFHSGNKNENASSTFSEIDSMGLNLLRLSYFIIHGKLPPCFIITGLNNPTARYFAEREKFQAVFENTKDKTLALNHITHQFFVKPEECAFIFDDILDLNLAAKVSLRIQIGRGCNPLTNQFIEKNQLADYRTAHSPENHALREIAEILISINQNFDACIQHRMHFDDLYQRYWALRQSQQTQFFNLGV